MKKRLSIIGTILAVMFVLFYLIDSNLGRDNLDALGVVRTAGSAALVTFAAYAAYNYLFWRIRPFNKLHHRPIISGTWICEAAPVNGKGEPLFLEMRIKQSYYDVSVSLKSKEFTSVSLICNLIQDSSGSYLYFTYISKPRKKYFNIHEVHHGTMRLHCQELVLVGQFFTSNFLGGNVEFYKRGIDSSIES